MSTSPSDIRQYIEWAAKTIPATYDERTRQIYETNASAALSAVQRHPFFRNMPDELEQIGGRFYEQKGADLLVERGIDRFNLASKPYTSALDKSYRHNVTWNKRWPSPPQGGWVTPDNLYERFDDIVRGTIVCKYFDAPAMLCAELEEYAKRCSLPARSASRQLDEGYYAYHYYVSIPFEVLQKDWTTRTVNLEVEVQATTQLQEAARELTGPFYRATRSSPEQDRAAWKWQHASPKFKAGYISHTLHLIEALIVELRGDSEPNAPETDDDNT